MKDSFFAVCSNSMDAVGPFDTENDAEIWISHRIFVPMWSVKKLTSPREYGNSHVSVIRMRLPPMGDEE